MQMTSCVAELGCGEYPNPREVRVKACNDCGACTEYRVLARGARTTTVTDMKCTWE